MLADIFKSVLILSASGSLAALLLLLLRPVTRKKFGCRWQYYIWLCPIIIMLLPISITFPAADAVITMPETVTGGEDYSTYIIPASSPPEAAAVYSETELSPPAAGDVSDTAPLNLPEPLTVLAAVWIIGSVVFFGGCLVSYFRFWRRIKRCSVPANLQELPADIKIPQQIRILRTDAIESPMLAGLFRPVLLLPQNSLSGEILTNVIRHELVHYRRRDLWYKWLSLIANSVHWFNPLSYVISRQIQTECEISCDLEATKGMDDEEKKGYMRTILSIAQEKIKRKNIKQP